jgi:hypothetical protein
MEFLAVLIALLVPLLVLLFVLGFFAVFVLVVFFVIRRSRKMSGDLEGLAKRLGFKFEKASFLGWPSATGEYYGRKAKFMLFHYGTGDTKVKVIRFEMQYKANLPREKGFFNKPLLGISPHRLLGGKKLDHALPEFNKRFSTRGKLVAQLVDSWLQHKMIELEKNKGAHLVVYSPGKKVLGKIVFMTTRGFSADPVFAQKVLETLKRVAEKVEETPV